MELIFVETTLFTETVSVLTDEELRAAQSDLLRNPEAGDVIPQTGGARKLRIRHRGKGKRGGARVIYVHVPAAERIYLLLVYPKGIADDISAAGRKVLRALVAEIREAHRHG